MNKKERFILEKLQEFFPSPAIPLLHQDPYTLLIAVLLSAQCTDARVNKVTPGLFAFADTPEKMAKLDVALIEKMIKTCGLYKQKASAIHRLSIILVEKFGGKVPKTFEELESLPGVGHKTASVVMSQAFQKLSFPVDTHIFRLARRWGLSLGKNVKEVEKDLKKIYPEKYWDRLHLQMIYYARKYCPAKGHRLENCPICREI
jgi:endonuclease III